MSAGNRVKYIDVARGIAILCIIIGHFGVYEVNRVVFTFHVPIFYIITGYFLSKKHEVKAFINDKIRTLLVPYIVTCIAMVILSMLFALLLERETVAEAARHWSVASIYGSGVDYKEPFVIHKIGAIWFLLASFFGSIFLRISLEMPKKVRFLFVLGLFLVGYLTTIHCFWFPFSIQAGCCATLFMYIGYLARQSQEIYETFPNVVKGAGVVIAFIIWVLFIKNYEGFWLAENYFGRGVIDIFGSVCACYIVIIFSKFMERYCGILADVLAYFGKYSLIVLCVHIVEHNLFPWREIKEMIMSIGGTELIANCIMAAIRLSFIFVVTTIFSKVKWITKLFSIKAAK